MKLDIEKLEVLTLQKGDVLVLTFERRVPQAVFERTRKVFRKKFPDVNIIFKEPGVELKAYRPLENG